MTEEDLRRIIHQAVQETLNGLGIDTSEKREMQADFIYIRKIRKGAEALGRTIGATTIAILVPSFLYMLWETVKSAIWR